MAIKTMSKVDNKWNLDYTINKTDGLKNIKFYTAGKKLDSDINIKISADRVPHTKIVDVTFTKKPTISQSLTSAYGGISITRSEESSGNYNLDTYEKNPSGEETKYNNFTYRWYDWSNDLQAHGNTTQWGKDFKVSFNHDSRTIPVGETKNYSAVPGVYIILQSGNKSCSVSFKDLSGTTRHSMAGRIKWFMIAPTDDLSTSDRNTDTGISVFWSTNYYAMYDGNTRKPTSQARLENTWSTIEIKNTNDGSGSDLRVLRIYPKLISESELYEVT